MKKFLLPILLLLISSINAHVSVRFDKEIYEPSEACARVISNIDNPHIVVWYIGESGLRNDGASFYKNNILNIFRDYVKDYKFFLYDISAWGALRNSNAKLNAISSNAHKINTSNLKHFEALTSDQFFTYLNNQDNVHRNEYIKNVILCREFIWKKSFARKLSGIKFGSIITNNHAFESINEFDTTRVYSPLQYLEGIYLIEEIIKKHCLANNNQKIDIVFLLANDELEYYRDDENSFEADLNYLLSNDGNYTNHIEANIHFIAFKYGINSYDRPYISRGVKLKPNQTIEYLT